MKKISKESLRAVKQVSVGMTVIFTVAALVFKTFYVSTTPIYGVSDTGRLTRTVKLKLPTTLTDKKQLLGHALSANARTTRNLKTNKNTTEIVLSSKYGEASDQLESQANSIANSVFKPQQDLMYTDLLLKIDGTDTRPTIRVSVKDETWGQTNENTVYLPSEVAGETATIQQSAKRVKFVQTNKKAKDRLNSAAELYAVASGTLLVVSVVVTWLYRKRKDAQ